MKNFCRHCNSKLEKVVIDLGDQPPSNAYLTCDQLDKNEKKFPLKVYTCTNCWLMQLPEHASASELFTSNYAYLSSTSVSWCKHAEDYVKKVVKKLKLGTNSMVVELASNDGYLLQYIKERFIPCVGIEPTSVAAEVARSKGIKTIEKFFGTSLAEKLISSGGDIPSGADLIIGNNVLAHVPDINDFLKGIFVLLKPQGEASLEFPHLLRLLKGKQFDTIYHEHYSYISLTTLVRITEKVGLHIKDVEELKTHGGSLRVWLSKEKSNKSKRVLKVLKDEQNYGLNTIEAYDNFQKQSEEIRSNFLSFLYKAREDNKKVYAYGAAAKGNTLINYAGVKDDLILGVADNAKSKQNKYLPGSHIPIISPSQLIEKQPDSIIILPWNLINELRGQFKKYEVVTAIPNLKIW